MEANWEEKLLSLAFQAQPASPSLPFWGENEERLRQAYRKAAVITAHYSKSFYFASAFLPKAKREAVRALYAFCRTVDDIVDVRKDHCDPARALQSWRQTLQHPPAILEDWVALAWVDTLHRYAIPRQYALQLIDGVAQDLEWRRYRTFEQLATYCYSVASTVGLMSMHIIGYKSQEAIPYAIRLGVALQLTNILRDVGEDYCNGRIYLPLEELEAFGLDESDLFAGQVTERWRNFMRFQIERARRLYAEAFPGIRLLHPDGQFAVAVALDVYRAILEKIEANDYDVFHRRASLSALEKVQRLPRIWWRMYS
ncbi:MAG: squalene/phytoene synthase family protein [Anaerolineales bacterium]|nr:squalene/phytoene synthase family protein [Anaerolineales bacterium]MCS7247618.1 squalene/phytoene synthase family protein [Anaerolineales bacterium]MDW8161429.1 squalene/phytoene synthase family protein [Anaerolineales bacterium]MDW8446654.1 squalene/phytoene synthase family protein [Anaerolineales bacterium]